MYEKRFSRKNKNEACIERSRFVLMKCEEMSKDMYGQNYCTLDDKSKNEIYARVGLH